jgi:uncharacterized protein (DUF427 family)
MTSGHTITTETTEERVRVLVAGEVLADTTNAVVLYETGLPPRYYLPREDVRMDLLEPTETATTCPFKGAASYWTVRIGDREVVDVAWSYETPIEDRAEIAGLVCFFVERVDEHHVGDQQLDRPATPWSELTHP